MPSMDNVGTHNILDNSLIRSMYILTFSSVAIREQTVAFSFTAVWLLQVKNFHTAPAISRTNVPDSSESDIRG